MKNFKNRVFKKRRELYVKERDLSKVIYIIQNVTGDGTTSVVAGNCCWNKAIDLFFIRFTSSTDNYRLICEGCDKENIVLYPETVGYTGYQY